MLSTTTEGNKRSACFLILSSHRMGMNLFNQKNPHGTIELCLAWMGLNSLLVLSRTISKIMILESNDIEVFKQHIS